MYEAFMKKHARDGSKIAPLIAMGADRLPSPFENRDEHAESAELTIDEYIPTTMRAAIRIMPETKLLRAQEQQDMWVAVEISGGLHNRHALADSAIDIVFVIDNGYYISKDCLTRATDTVTSALCHLTRGDRVALYTTHCTHGPVSSTVPDMMYPLRPLGHDTDEILRHMNKDIVTCGAQTWDPPRPNPTMSDVVLAVAKSLESKDIERGRTHVVLLTPTSNVLHGISEAFPRLYVHQINPAVLPYLHSDKTQEKLCEERCCKNVFISNWAYYQSLPSRIKQIIRYARSKRPLGVISRWNVEIRPRKGCEVLEYQGSTDIRRLRLGQVHSFFIRVRITRSETQELDLNSKDPILISSLEGYSLHDDLRNAKAVGATNAHLLSVQVLHKHSNLPHACWSYTESPLVVYKELGRLAHPIDMSMELYKRQCFYKLSRLDPDAAKAEIERLAIETSDRYEELKKLVEHMALENCWHKSVSEYETTTRQQLPICPGPICLASAPHEWLVEKWDAKKNKRKGMAVV
ncbi:hypothetical protein K458DRAFT_426908 [Lentithecium fluviatile CBS 122367]|uniref:Uncharacterized protein n=1 Tax=Lentithecium fluviatile CBS 122367 TaxID=1168545 RepID=A0A6G1JIU1_9PLEO|nr:hypothetical protein K458DRAFT_426908 [Lentithecium fluviatile CBS 122367]